MSEKGFAGGTIQIPTSVRWGGNGTVGDVGGNNCMYVFQVVDQNGDPILMRQQVKVGTCACTTAAGTTDAGLGFKEPNATEIASSVFVASAATVFVTAAGGAVTVNEGSTDDTGDLHLAGFIGAYGTMQTYIPENGGAGNDYLESIFETDSQGRFSMRSTALTDRQAIVLTLASGKTIFFNNVRAA